MLLTRSGEDVVAYIRALQRTAILGFTLRPRISLIRMKTLRENVEPFRDYDIGMPEDLAALEAGLRELIDKGLLRASEGELRYVSVTDEGSKYIITD